MSHEAIIIIGVHEKKNRNSPRHYYHSYYARGLRKMINWFLMCIGKKSATKFGREKDLNNDDENMWSGLGDDSINFGLVHYNDSVFFWFLWGNSDLIIKPATRIMIKSFNTTTSCVVVEFLLHPATRRGRDGWRRIRAQIVNATTRDGERENW